MSRSHYLAESARALLRVDPEDHDRILSRENSRLEFKESFNWGHRGKYARTMAAFANAGGGFLVFGVANAPRRIVGVNVERFERLDAAQATEFLCSQFSPEIDWEMFRLEVSGHQLGVVAVVECSAKPVVCIKNHSDSLREADIYYRYRGRTDRIKYPEIQAILSQRAEDEREGWLRLVQSAGSVGINNIGILNVLSGELSGSKGRLMIGPELLEKIKFIKEGQFTEESSEGTPVLRLVGDVERASQDTGSIRMIPTPVVVGEREIVEAFLRQQEPSQPRPYLKQICRESTWNLPLFYFASLAGMTQQELRSWIAECEGRAQVREKLDIRVRGQRIDPIGTISGSSSESVRRTEFLTAITHGNVPQLVRATDRLRLLEACTHYHPEVVPINLFGFLYELLRNGLDGFGPAEKTAYRKAVAHLDEVLFGDSYAPQ